MDTTYLREDERQAYDEFERGAFLGGGHAAFELTISRLIEERKKSEVARAYQRLWELCQQAVLDEGTIAPTVFLISARNLTKAEYEYPASPEFQKRLTDAGISLDALLGHPPTPPKEDK